MKKLLACSLAVPIFLGVATLYAQNLNKTFQITPYSESRFYGWKEFETDGTQLLSANLSILKTRFRCTSFCRHAVTVRA